MDKDIHRVRTISIQSTVHLDAPVQLREIDTVTRDVIICHTDTKDIPALGSRLVRLTLIDSSVVA